MRVTLEAVGDDELADRVTEAARTTTLPEVLQMPMASAHEYARQRILGTDAAPDVVRDLSEARSPPARSAC